MKKFLIIVSALVCAVSCEYLNELPTTSLQAGLYDTEEGLETQIYGILGRFYGSTGATGEGNEFLAISTPIIHWGIQSSTTRNDYYYSCQHFTQYGTSPKNQNYFRKQFTIVNACNVLIANLADSPVDEEYKKEIEAEARFYRAFTYFRIVRTWGDAPIRKETINLANLNAKRDPYFDEYAFIVEDLKFAFENMRSPERVDKVTPLKSRVNKYAASALLSSVYCTIGSLLTSPDDNFWNNTLPERQPDFSAIGITSAEDAYRLALAEAEKLLPESSSYDPGCPYRLVDHFGDLFRWDSDAFPQVYTLPERVFVLPITKLFGKEDVTLPEYSLPPYAEGTDYRDDLVATGRGRWRPDRWAFQHWCEDYPGTKGVDNAANIYYDSIDPRFNLTFYSGMVYNQQTKAYKAVYPHSDMIKKTPGKEFSYPFLRKYWSKHYSADAGEADLYLMRFAEVYFNAIEAACELGDNNKAYSYMDIIHKRARRSVAEGQPEAAMPKWKSGQFTTKEEMRTQIFWERIYEFIGEFHEYDECHRHGATWMLEELCKPANAFMLLPEQAQLFKKDYFYPYGEGDLKGLQYPPYDTDVNDVRKGLLFGYPNTELNYNDALTMNDQNDFSFGY